MPTPCCRIKSASMHQTSDLSEHRAKKKMMNLSHVQQEQKKTNYLMPQDKYTKNASLVAILIITITFIAVFSTVHVARNKTSSFKGVPAGNIHHSNAVFPCRVLHSNLHTGGG